MYIHHRNTSALLLAVPGCVQCECVFVCVPRVCVLLCSAQGWKTHGACRVVKASTGSALFRLLYFIVDFLEAEGYGIKTRVEGLGDICYA